MTREEAIARIKEHMNIHKMNEPRAIYISEALDMAIEALEQEPCDDCISRQMAIDAVNIGNLHPGIVDALQSILAELPPVTQHQKTGYWISNKAKNYPGWVHCSECGEDWTHDGRPPYCPACGARMTEPQESEG